MQTSKTRRCVVLAVLLAALFSYLAMRRADARPRPVVEAGRSLPSERSVWSDPATGREVTFLTNSPAQDVKIYQTHPSWTADGAWIVFHSDRTGSRQLFAVHEASGRIVQLTSLADVETGQVAVSRKRPELVTVSGREVVRLDLSPTLTLDESEGRGGARRRPPAVRVIGQLPGAAVLSGTLSLDAAEDAVYLGLEHGEGAENPRWSIVALDVETGRLRTVIEPGFPVGHVQANPERPEWIAYCHETGGDAPQRMWVVRADGSGNRPLYRETYGEWVTHEIWQDGDRALFTIWPKNEAMRRLPHGLASVTLAGEVTFHARYPYWHVAAAPGSTIAVADSFDGELFRVDLESGARTVITRGHRAARSGAHLHPTLHPDGDRVLFNSNLHGNADLAILSVDAPQAPRDAKPLRSLRYRRGTAVAASRWQREVRRRLVELLALEDLVAAEIPLEPGAAASRTRSDAYVVEELTLRSTPGRTIRAVVTRPRKGTAPFPAVVCIHGHGGDRWSVHDPSSIYKGFASQLAARGHVTISTDVGQHRVYEKGRTLLGERLWDLRRCVDYLETLSDVDGERIGCAGLSLGGEMAMWLGALDPRVKATVSSGFLTIMDHMETNHCPCWKLDGLRELVDFADIYGLTAPRALLCQNGRREPVTQFWVPLAGQAMREIRRVYVDVGARDNVALAVHEGAHEIDLPSLLAFLETHLDR